MRKRITRSVVLIVLGALLLSGLGSTILIYRANRQINERDLATQASGVAQLGETQGQTFIRNARRVLNLEGASIFAIANDKSLSELGPETVTPNASLPSPLDPSDLNIALLSSGNIEKGAKNGTVYAIAPIGNQSAANTTGATTTTQALSPARQLLRQKRQAAINNKLPNTRLVVVVLTRKVNAGLGAATTYILLSAAVAFLIAAAVAEGLARRITRPISDAEKVTRNIAAGNFSTRVEMEKDRDPELVSLGNSINHMAESLELSRESERNFFMSVSHDLRTPLTSIQGYAEAIFDEATDPKQAALIIGRESGRLSRLVLDLLDLGRLETHQFSLHMTEVRVQDALSKAIETLQPTAVQYQLSIQSELVNPLLMIHVDPDRLQQILINVGENSLKYASSTVQVRVTAEPTKIYVSFTDDGEGIPDSDLPRIFERLYTSRSSHRAVGTGVGLAIVAQMTHAMHGSVKAENVKPHGARLTIELPATSPEI